MNQIGGISLNSTQSLVDSNGQASHPRAKAELNPAIMGERVLSLGAWLARSEEHASPDLQVVSSGPTSGEEIT